MLGEIKVTTTIQTPNLHAGIATRLGAYLGERFPLLGNALLILSFYSSNQFLAHALNEPGQPMRYDLTTVCGFLTIVCFFLHMRVFDDHKDFVEDSRFFPNRVLQSGTVTLRELKFVAGAAIGIQIMLSATVGMATLLSWTIAFVFSVLMLKEFFVRQWLKQRFLLYASVHMLIMPLLAMVIWSFATRRFFWEMPPWYWLYSMVGFFLAFNWEVSRKICAPEDEREELDSYSRLFGAYRAAYLVLVIRMISTALVALVALHLGLSVCFYLLLVLLFLVCLVGSFQYRFRTSTATAKRLGIYAGVYIVAFDLALAIELGRKFGIDWSGTL
jgi:4-hydroxybenzoate polyprenyltransferase